VAISHVDGHTLAKANSHNPARLAFGGSTILEKSGLRISRPISHRKWEIIGQKLLSMSESSTWWIADWLCYGEHTFQDRYPEAVRRTSLNYQTLRNYVWVAQRFDSSRRRDTLSFGHHAEVAALDQPEQDYWLRKADELGWSRNQLRREVRASLTERQGRGEVVPAAEDAQLDDAPDEHVVSQRGSGRTLQLEVTPSQFKQFIAAAGLRKLSLNEWAIEVLRAAAIPPG
jgi:hypothetical protein